MVPCPMWGGGHLHPNVHAWLVDQEHQTHDTCRAGCGFGWDSRSTAHRCGLRAAAGGTGQPLNQVEPSHKGLETKPYNTSALIQLPPWVSPPRPSGVPRKGAAGWGTTVYLLAAPRPVQLVWLGGGGTPSGRSLYWHLQEGALCLRGFTSFWSMNGHFPSAACPLKLNVFN